MSDGVSQDGGDDPEEASGNDRGGSRVDHHAFASSESDLSLIRTPGFPTPGGTGRVVAGGDIPEPEGDDPQATDQDSIGKQFRSDSPTGGHNGSTDGAPHSVFESSTGSGLDGPGQDGSQEWQQEYRELLELPGVLGQLHQRIEDHEGRHRESDEDDHHHRRVLAKELKRRSHQEPRAKASNKNVEQERRIGKVELAGQLESVSQVRQCATP